MKKPNQKVLKLEKETLVKLQESQMKALIGADNNTVGDGGSGGVCTNDVTLGGTRPQVPTPAPDPGTKAPGMLDNSCCRRSCNNPAPK